MQPVLVVHNSQQLRVFPAFFSPVPAEARHMGSPLAFNFQHSTFNFS